MTAIEIKDGTIRLVHFFDGRISSKYFSYNGYEPVRLGHSDYYRMLIKKDKLKYIFSRINLLA